MSVVVERAYVALVVQGDDPQRLPDVVAAIGIDDLTDPDLRVVYRACRSLVSAGYVPDPPTVLDELHRSGAWTEDAAWQLATLLDAALPGIPGALERYARRLREARQARRLREMASALADEASRGAGDRSAIERAVGGLTELLDDGPDGGPSPAARYLPQTMAILEQRGRSRGITGVPSGLGRLDWLLGGWQPGRVYTVAARPGQGKSILAAQLAAHAATVCRVPTLVESIEMSAPQLLLRMVASLSGVPLRRGIPRGGEEAVRAAVARLQAAPLHIDDAAAGLSLGDLRSRVRAGARQHGVGLVLLDYLQLLSGTSQARTRLEEVSEVTRGVKMLARAEEVPIVQLAQLRRLPESTSRAPQLSDLRESGTIEQDSDVVIALWPQGTEEQLVSLDRWAVKLLVLKNRDGETGQVLCALDRPTTTIREVSREEFFRLVPPPPSRR